MLRTCLIVALCLSGCGLLDARRAEKGRLNPLVCEELGGERAQLCTDAETGCQYLWPVGAAGATPRAGADGRQLGCGAGASK